ncbi:MAG TPA: energy transducer TonB [Longimicrobium sp.]|nr:energy transducer TonB [Longimicrobium sp.]
MTHLAPAPPASALRVRRYPGGGELALAPAWEVGAGGEARVFALPGGAQVAKLYHVPTLERAEKLAWMVEHPPALPPGGAVSLAWPGALLTDARECFAGFVMPFAAGPRLFELYNPVTRRAQAPLFHWGLLHRGGARVAAAFDAVHAAGYVVGDVNESNLLVAPGGAVAVVDTDSFQVRDGGAAVYRSRVGKAEFTPPELQGVSFAEVDRTPGHDRFGLAVLLFLALMEGTHPFAARFRPGEEAPPLEERIARGLFPYAAGGAPVLPPRLAPRFDALDPGLRALFVTAFVDGHADPSVRPTAAEWRAALEEAEGALVVCGGNAQHRFGAHLGACPWCERARLLRGRDPFPATEEEARRTELEAPPAPPPSPAAETPAVPPRSPVSPPAPPPSAGTVPAAPVHAPAPTLAPHQPFAALVAQPAWAPLLGPSGARHPLAWLLPALVLVLGGGGVWIQVAGLAALTLLLTGLLETSAKARPVTRATLVTALVLALLAGGVVAATRPDAPDRVHRTEEVDQRPFLINEDVISQDARESGLVGEAVVWLVVEPDGTIDPASIRVHDSSSPELAEVAERVARQASYIPATVDGRPVRAEARIPLVLFIPRPDVTPAAPVP